MIDTVWIISFDGIILDVNPTVEKQFEYTPEELIGKRLSFVDSNLAQLEKQGPIKMKPHKKLQVFETAHTSKSGIIIPVEISSTVVQYENQKCILCISRDMTERKEAEAILQKEKKRFQKLSKDYQLLNEELFDKVVELQSVNKQLESAKAQAEESDRLKSIFLANMSHEVRTPLNAILGFTALFEKPKLSDEKRLKYVQIIKDSGRRLMHLIDDIIDISKLEARQLPMHIEPIYIHKLITTCYNTMKIGELYKKKSHINFELHIPPNIKQLVSLTDKVRFQQVLDNLLTNALKYTKEGLIKVGATIHEQYSNMLEIYVEDTGIGIKKEKHTLIFEQFRQAEEESYNEGKGLGLTIAKGIVELLGGEIYFSSVYGKGSRFSFTIPIEADAEKYQSTEMTGEQIPDLRNRTIIILDSSEQIVNSIKKTGALYMHVPDETSLMKLIYNTKPELIIVNTELLQNITISEIKKTHISSDDFQLKAIGISPKENHNSIAEDCDAHLYNPIDISKFFSTIKKILI